MSDVVNTLRRQEFPKCALSALKHMGLQSVSSNSGGIPGLGDSSDDLPEQLAREFVFRETKGAKKLNAIQELQLLEVLIHYFQDERNEQSKHGVFRILFGIPLAVQRKDILGKLISMAIGVKNSSILNCAAIWMQRLGCSTEVVTSLVECVIQDYCILVPSASSTLHLLPELSPHFTCNLMAAVTCIYHPLASAKNKHMSVPMPLLELLTEWIQNDSQLCLVSLNYAKSSYMEASRSSLWTSPTKPNTQTPIPGLVRWCTQAPLHCADDEPHSGESKQDVVWSKLHLAVLQTLVAFPYIPGANQLELITLADMNRIVKEVVNLLREATGGLDLPQLAFKLLENEGQQLAVNRLVQLLQVALAKGGFRCSLGDLQSICNSIPQNKLLDILQMQHLSRMPPPMHYESR